MLILFRPPSAVERMITIFGGVGSFCHEMAKAVYFLEAIEPLLGLFEEFDATAVFSPRRKRYIVLRRLPSPS